MNNTANLDQPLPEKKTAATLVPLILAGLAGNYFGYEIFFSIQFIFGSIFAMLALQRSGLRQGVLAAFLISCMTYHLWNHPYAIVIMTAEVAVVGFLKERRGLGLVLADALYWVFIGIPLVILFYFGVMHLPFYTVSITMMKQAVNGITNALIARLIFMAYEYRFTQGRFSLRELMFSLLALFMLVPSLLLLAVQSRAEMERTDKNVDTSLQLASERTAQSLEAWLQSGMSTVEHLAWMASTQPIPVVQRELDQIRSHSQHFFRMGLLDHTATIVAYSPLLDELGKSNLGVNFADRPYLPGLKQSLKPMMTDVVMGKLGTPRPIATAIAPVVKRGVFAGYTVGVLDFDKAQSMISRYMRGASLPGVRFMLLDHNDKIIVSSVPGLKTSAVFKRPGGDAVKQENSITHWVPFNAKNISVSDRWKNALYISETEIGGAAGWKLILEQPMAPFQKQLYERYAKQLLWVFAMLLGAVAIAEFASRKFVDSLNEVNTLSTDMPAKVSTGSVIEWPESAIQETQSLIENFRASSQTLSRQFNEVRELTANLENRVSERTRELQESESKYRILFDNDVYAICIFDVETLRFLDVNNAYEKVYGWTRDELLSGMTIHDITAEHQASDASTVKAVREGTTFIPLRYHRKKDGMVFPVEIVGGPYTWKGKRVMFALAHDITERWTAEHKLAKVKREQEIILENATVGISLIVDRKQVWMNQKAVEMFGYPRNELEGQTTRKLYPTQEAYDRLGKEAYPLLAQGFVYNTVQHLVRGDGKHIWVHYSGKAIDPSDLSKGVLWILEDITVRKKIEDALKLSELKLRTMIDASPIPYALNDNEQNITFLNAAFVKNFGYTVEDIPTLRDWWPRAYPDPAYRELVAAQWQSRVEKAMREGTDFEPMEVKVRCKNGEVRTVIASAAALGASFTGEHLAILYDITDRKQAEERINQLHQEQSTILETLTIGVALIKDRTVQWANAAHDRIFGYESCGTVGCDTEALYPDTAAYQQFGAEAYRQLAQGNTYTAEREMKRRDNTLFWCSLTGRAVNPANLDDGSIWMVQDITERRQAEEALRDSEDRFRSLFERIHMVALIIDPSDGAIRDANTAATTFYGWTRTELLAKKITDINILSPEEVRLEMEAAKIEQRSHFLFRHRRANGDIRDVEVYSGPFQTKGKTLLYSVIHDITDRTRAERQVADAKNYIETLLRTSPVGIATYKATGEAVSVNNAIARIVGSTTGNLIKQNFRTIGSWKTSRMLEYAEQALATQTEQRHDIHVKTTYGREVDLDCLFIPFTFSGEQHIMLTAVDITERKKIEANLQQLANEQKAILDTTTIGIVYAKGRRLTWTNPAFRDMFGFTEQETAELDARKLYATEADFERIGKEGYAAVNNGEAYSTEAHGIRTDGTTFWLNLIGRAVNPADPEAGSIWILQDISERKRSEQALRESEARNRAMLAAIPDLMFVQNNAGVFLDYHAPDIQKLLVPPGTFLGKRTQDVLPPPVVDIFVPKLKQAIETGRVQFLEYMITMQDGPHHFEGRISPFDGDKVLSIVRDITERKLAEKTLQEKTSQLEDLTRNLEHRVAEEVSLRKKNEDILVQQSKLAAMGEMLGAIAHQWRQPLNALGLIIQNIRDAYDHGELNRTHIDKSVQKSMSQIQHMSETIDDFRRFFRPDKERATFDAMLAVGEVLSLFSAQLVANDIEFILICKSHNKTFTRVEDIESCPEKMVSGFPNEFEHVILNLINNSREAILERREHGLPGRGVLKFVFSSANGRLLIDISDNGGGIPGTAINRIFEPYFTTKDPAKGTGLGLYMSKVIIEEHMGGTLSARNEEQGASFIIELQQEQSV